MINKILLMIASITGMKFACAQSSVNLEHSTFMSGLESPWDAAFSADSSMFYTERCKGLSVRHPDGTTTRLFGTQGSSLVATDLHCQGQSGVNGVALDPDFANNRTIYVYMTSKAAQPKTNHVVRLDLDPAFTVASNRVDIITDIPFKNKGNAWGGAGSHSGGRLRFGPDNFLYVTTGDNHNGTIPQDLASLGGKVLRVDRNGAGAPGNNSAGDPRIFTYGHRNVQGIAFHPQTGQPFVSEHGPGHSDEITALVAGGNGGWDPKPDAGVHCDDDYCGYISNKSDNSPTSMTDLKKFPNAMPPALVNPDSEGMGPLVFLTGPQWKEWDGTLAVGIMAGQRVDVITLDANKNADTVVKTDLPSARARSLVQGPDGFLYVVTDSGNIWLVKPAP